MRWLVVPLVFVATAAHAAPVDDLETTGQSLARDGKYVEAIATFREAERSEPRAIHDCLIGLAYFRMGKLTEAEITFGDCNRRAGAPANLPAWVAKEQAAATAQLAQSTFGTVDVAATADIATLSIPGVLDGESFAARPQLRLAPGTYKLTGHSTDGRAVTREITVAPRGTTRATLSLTVDATPSSGGSEVPRKRTGPLTLTIAGGAVVVAGAAMHLFWAHPARVDADKATETGPYNEALDRFKTARAATIASYAVGGVALIAGLVWWKRASAPETPHVSGYVTGDGAGLVVQWQR